jgi:hypothetical protein
MILSDDGVEQAFRPAAKLLRAAASAAEVILWDSAVQRPKANHLISMRLLNGCLPIANCQLL